MFRIFLTSGYQKSYCCTDDVPEVSRAVLPVGSTVRVGTPGTASTSFFKLLPNNNPAVIRQGRNYTPLFGELRSDENRRTPELSQGRAPALAEQTTHSDFRTKRTLPKINRESFVIYFALILTRSPVYTFVHLPLTRALTAYVYVFPAFVLLIFTEFPIVSVTNLSLPLTYL